MSLNLVNSDGRDYSKMERVVSNRVRVGANYPASFIKKKSGLGVDTGEESRVQYAREGCIR